MACIFLGSNADDTLPLPKCDTPDNLNTLWPNCTDPKQFCVCTAVNKWICLPCPQHNDHFMFESQTCESLEEEVTTVCPPTTVSENQDAGAPIQHDEYNFVRAVRNIPTPPTRGPFILPTPALRISNEPVKKATVPSPPTVPTRKTIIDKYPTPPTQLPFVYKLKTAVPTPPKSKFV